MNSIEVYTRDGQFVGVVRDQLPGKRYRWKKAVANIAMIWIGVIVAHTGLEPSSVPWQWAFWKPVLTLACTTTLFGELRYIYAWLLRITEGNNHG